MIESGYIYMSLLCKARSSLLSKELWLKLVKSSLQSKEEFFRK